MSEMQVSADAARGAEAGRPAGGSILGQPTDLLVKIVALSALLLLLTQLLFSWYALRGYEQVLKPQLERKAEAVGHAVANLVEFAMDDLQISIGDLFGVESYFEGVMGANAEIKAMALVDSAGEVLYSGGDPDALMSTGDDGTTSIEGMIVEIIPVLVGGEPAANLVVGVSNQYVSDRLSDIYFDVLTVIVVSWLVTLEFMVFFMNTQIVTPLQSISLALSYGRKGVFSHSLAVATKYEIGRLVGELNELLHSLQHRYEDFVFEVREIRNAQLDRRVAEHVHAQRLRIDGRFSFTHEGDIRPHSSAQIRIALFLMMFAEELSRSFLPLFVERLSPAASGFSTEVLVSLPISLFMLLAAAFTPIGGMMADRIGARRVFLIGVIPAAVGYFGTFLTFGYYDFLLWRSLTGIGYGLIFIAAQAWVSESSTGARRAKNMSVFVGAVFVGMICGPPIGGIIAGRLGFEITFLLSAGLSLLAGIIVYRMLGERRRVVRSASRSWFNVKAWRLLFVDPEFFSVTFLLAVPGKFVSTGFFFFLVPLYLSELGNSQSMIGWIMMLYGIVTFAGLPAASWIADHTGRYSLVAATGVALTGIGCLAGLPKAGIFDGTWSVAIAIVMLGVGHALSLTSQVAVVQGIAARHSGSIGQASAISAYRLVERAGLVLGPVVAAPLAVAYGYGGAIAWIGAIALACVALFVAMAAASKAQGRPSREAA